MASGITLKKNLRGDVTAVTINIKKYGALLKDFFREVGIEDKVYAERPNAKTRKAIRDAKKGKGEDMTIEEFRNFIYGL